MCTAAQPEGGRSSRLFPPRRLGILLPRRCFVFAPQTPRLSFLVRKRLVRPPSGFCFCPPRMFCSRPPPSLLLRQRPPCVRAGMRAARSRWGQAAIPRREVRPLACRGGTCTSLPALLRCGRGRRTRRGTICEGERRRRLSGYNSAIRGETKREGPTWRQLRPPSSGQRHSGKGGMGILDPEARQSWRVVSSVFHAPKTGRRAGG
jgi:hypothetical protein